jgi:chromosome segregation ATPase
MPTEMKTLLDQNSKYEKSLNELYEEISLKSKWISPDSHEAALKEERAASEKVIEGLTTDSSTLRKQLTELQERASQLQTVLDSNKTLQESSAMYDVIAPISQSSNRHIGPIAPWQRSSPSHRSCVKRPPNCMNLG